MGRAASRGRRSAILFAALGSGILAASVAVFHDRILEEWWISRFGARDPEDRAAAATKLGEVGSGRSARALLAILRERQGPGDAAVASLGKIFERVEPRVQAEIVRGLFSSLRAADEPSFEWKSPEGFSGGTLFEVLYGLKPRADEVFVAFTDELTQEKTAIRAVAALAKAWPHCRGYLSRFFAEEPLERVLVFYRFLRFDLLAGNKPEDLKEDLSRSFALDHPKPEIRAISLAFHVLCPSVRIALEKDTLKQVYSRDLDPLVRIAAIRIAGWIGDVPGNLDLRSLLLEENDPRFLQEIIQARTLWTSSLRAGMGFQVCPGAAFSLPPLPDEELKARTWELAEVERLKDILMKEKNPSLRDAASLALVERESQREAPPEEPVRHPALKVHEWGVWRDGEDRLLPSEDLVADLPPFVHRSRITVRNLRRHRQRPGIEINCKPVVFFHSPDSVTVRVRVEFRGGRPWTFYPEITDYLEGVAVDGAENENELSPFERKGLNPPWPLEPQVPAARRTDEAELFDEGFPKPPEGELRRRYSVAPWIIDQYVYRWHGSGLSGGIGLEWTGLRIGYGEALEGSFPAAEAGSWWSFLREVPSSPVALRGDHEKFLFYDGAIQLPSPVSVRWADEERRALRLRPRALRDYSPDLEFSSEPGPPTQYLPGIFVIRKEAGRPARGRFVPHVPPGANPIRVDLESLPLDDSGLHSRLDAVLREEGLTPEESRALIRTWEKEFFDQGLRVLTVLPGWIYQLMLPMEIVPAPGELVRVGVVWKECQELEIDSAPDREAAQKAASPPQPFKARTRELQFTEEALHPEPSEPLVPGPDGLISGLPPGNEKVVLSGDGKRLVFARHHAASPGIYLADLDSQAITRLVDLTPEIYVDDYSVSGDGDQVAYLVEGGRFRVRVASVEKRAVLDVYSSEDQFIRPWIHLAAEGKKLVFLENKTPVVVDLESRRATFIELPGAEDSRYPALTPDGSRLVLLSGQEFTENWKVLVVDLLQGTFAQVEGGRPLFTPPSISAAGNRVIFIEDEERQAYLAMSDLPGGGPVRLARADENEADSLCLTADGKTLLFLLYRDGKLWTTDLETGRSQEAASLAGHEIGSIAASADGKRVLLRAIDRERRDAESLHFLKLK